MIGKTIAVIISEEKVFRGSGVEKLIKNGFVQVVEKTYLTKDGRRIPVLFSGSVMRDEKGDIQGIVCNFHARFRCYIIVKSRIPKKERHVWIFS